MATSKVAHRNATSNFETVSLRERELIAQVKELSEANAKLDLANAELKSALFSFVRNEENTEDDQLGKPVTHNTGDGDKLLKVKVRIDEYYKNKDRI